MQQISFDNIKRYLSSPPVLKAPKAEILFQLYIATEDRVIGVVLTQITDGKEHIITYLNISLLLKIEIIGTFDDFTIQHVARSENTIANDLAQQASGFQWS